MSDRHASVSSSRLNQTSATTARPDRHLAPDGTARPGKKLLNAQARRWGGVGSCTMVASGPSACRYVPIRWLHMRRSTPEPLSSCEPLCHSPWYMRPSSANEKGTWASEWRQRKRSCRGSCNGLEISRSKCRGDPAGDLQRSSRILHHPRRWSCTEPQEIV